MKEWIKQGSGGAFPPQPTVTVLPPGGVQQPAPQALACAQPGEIQKLFTSAGCIVCHSAVMKAGMLDLETGGAAGAKARLVGQRARFGGSCIGRVLANTDGTGFLFEKLSGPVPIGCGQLMPFGFAPLSPDQVNCVREWVKN